MPLRRPGTVATPLALFAALSGCAVPGVRLPAGPAEPMADVRAAFDEATRACRGIRTLSAELRLSGRIGRARVRGRLHAGMAQPALVRLEAIAPFGPPLFVLVADVHRATLLLPRDDLVLEGAAPVDVVDALIGIPWSGADLRTVLTGCAPAAAQPGFGRRYREAWEVIDADGTTVYLRSDGGRRRLVALVRDGLQIEFGNWRADLPRRMRARSHAAATATIDLTVEIADLETNVELDPHAFVLDVPMQARRITVDELRRRSPIGERR